MRSAISAPSQHFCQQQSNAALPNLGCGWPRWGRCLCLDSLRDWGGPHKLKAVKSSGTVFLVGAGPGDAGLITVRGAELLGRAEVVVYDALVNLDLLR